MVQAHPEQAPGLLSGGDKRSLHKKAQILNPKLLNPKTYSLKSLASRLWLPAPRRCDTRGT